MSHRNKQPSLFELTARDEFEPLRQCSCLGSRHLTLTTRHFSLRGKRVFSLSRGRGYPSAGGRVRGRRRKEIRIVLSRPCLRPPARVRWQFVRVEGSPSRTSGRGVVALLYKASIRYPAPPP